MNFMNKLDLLKSAYNVCRFFLYMQIIFQEAIKLKGGEQKH